MKVVIARYNEDISWANNINNCLIYNKGNPITNTPHPCIQLNNVGREGHTYLYHIINNYDNLDDYTFFLQGNPFDHISDLESFFSLFKNNIDKPFTPIYRLKYVTTLESDNTHLGGLPLLECFNIFFDKKGKFSPSHPFEFGAGAQFIVSKESILSRPKSFYERIIKLVDYDINPIEGFCLERFWHMIFTNSD